MNSLVLQSFKQAIKNGTGEAILILMDNPLVNLDKLIVKACTHNLAYDPQCEGSRADYLFDILTLAKNQEKIEDTIVDNLLHARENDWDTTLLFDLVRVLAFNGNQQARIALYERYSNNIEPNFDFTETDALVILDGIKGLEFTAEIQGKNIKLDSKYWVDNWLLEVCQEYYPSSSPKQYLIDKSKENIHIHRYLSELQETNSLRENLKPRPQWTLSQITELISKGKPIGANVGKNLKEDELIKLVDDFQKERDDKKIEIYLRIFSKVKYLGNISYIIPFISSENSRISYLALSVLSHTNHPIIRGIIENNYTDLNFLKDNMKLFVSNFKFKDIDILSSIVDLLKDEDEIHSVIGDVMDVLENNIIEKPSKLLNPLYKLNNCSICRKRMIKILMHSDDLSEIVFQELKYDCDEEIRELSNNYKK